MVNGYTFANMAVGTTAMLATSTLDIDLLIKAVIAVSTLIAQLIMIRRNRKNKR